MTKLVNYLIFTALSSFAMGVQLPAQTDKPSPKPNIILFLVDDMGWMDCGAYGSKYYKTPNIDALAEQGMLFTNAYSANPLCSPTRASLLTGKYPARHGTTSASGHRPPQPAGYVFLPETAPANQKIIMPESKNYLDPSEYTIAEALRDAGYRTAHLGKWHMGLTPEYWPDKQGFDVTFHCAPDAGPPDYFSPYGVHADGKPSGPHKVGNITDGPDGEHIMDRLAAEAEKFIEESREGPFLLHLWSYGVHGPWQAKEEYTKKYAQTTDPRGVQGNPVMASMLQSVDECLGRIVAKLKEEGLSDNTIILFTSDNGGNIHSNTKPASPKREANVDWLKSYRRYADHLPPTNNYPLKRGKNWTFEGGIRVPFIAVWPGVVKPGSRNDEIVGSVDFYLTMLEMAGVQRNPKQVVDGVSMIPVLKANGKIKRNALFNYQPHGGPSKPASVVAHSGDWKLIRRFETSPDFPDKYLLFNLRDDIGESNNLAAKLPDKVKEMDAMIDNFLKETGALVPKPNPAYKPVKKPPAKSAPAKPVAKSVGKPAADSFQGLKPRFCKATAKEGYLLIEATGKKPYLGTARVKLNGPLTMKMNFQTRGGGPARVEWCSSVQDDCKSHNNAVDFSLKRNRKWQEVSINIPADGMLKIIRLYLPVDIAPMKIRSIEYSDQAGKIKRFDFGQ